MNQDTSHKIGCTFEGDVYGVLKNWYFNANRYRGENCSKMKRWIMATSVSTTSAEDMSSKRLVSFKLCLLTLSSFLSTFE